MILPNSGVAKKKLVAVSGENVWKKAVSIGHSHATKSDVNVFCEMQQMRLRRWNFIT